nr:PREDICTED: secretory phospholipase A2 receptor-like [Stegastes partitus]
MFNTPKTWLEAQSFCREKCLDLTTINNMTEMDAVLKAVGGKYDDALWFGLWQGVEFRTHWSLVDTDFSDIAEGFSQHWAVWARDSCVVFKDKLLHSQSCTEIYHSACFDATKQGADQYITAGMMNWLEGQEYCRTNHTDLTNIRSEAELQFISALAGSGSVWVGGFTDRWEWSDQSTSSFRYWRSNEKFWGSDGGECGVLTKNGRWGRLSCSEKRPFLCTCKDPAIKPKVVKVRINLQDSSLDPNDPSVQDKILEQMMQKLSKSGVGDVKLRWKKQPDGKVFIPAAP